MNFPLSIIFFLVISVSNGFSAKDLKIASHNKIIASLIRQVADEDVALGTLISDGAHSHHTSLKPSEVKNLNEADLFFYNGIEFGSLDVLTLSADHLVDLAKIKNLKLLPARTSVCCDQIADSMDSHFCLDLDNVRLIVKHIRDVLSEKDPERKKMYEKNCQVFLEQIDDLEKLSTRLLRVKNIYIMDHDISQYIDARFETKLVATFGSDEHSKALKPDIIKKTLKAIEINKATHLVVENQYPMPNYQELLGVKVVPIIIDADIADREFWPAYYKALVYAIADYQE